MTWTCEAFNGGTCPASGEGSLHHSVDLPAGAELIYTVRGVRDPASIGQIITNTAAILAPLRVMDCNPTNNTDTVVNEMNTFYLPLVTRSRVPVQAPDLVVDSIVATSTGVEVTIKNRGILPAEDPFWLDVYLGPVRPLLLP